VSSINEDRKIWEQYFAKVIEDIKRYGWHLVYIKGSATSPGFCFTIGLMQTYKHPEILLFAPTDALDAFIPVIKPIVDQIAAGKSFKDGDILPEAFNRFSGAFRKVLPLYLSTFMGSAMRYYNQPNVETLQLFWPDGNNHYPWHSDFPSVLFGHQPVLFQDNIFLTGLSDEDNLRLLGKDDTPLLDSSKKVLIDHSQLTEQADLDTWAPQLPKGSTLHGVTIFGDPLLLAADGTIDWLNTNDGQLKPLAANANQLECALLKQAHSLFYPSVYLHANEQDRKPQPGEVFSWRVSPAQGGVLHLDNLETLEAGSHLKRSATSFNEQAP